MTCATIRACEVKYFHLSSGSTGLSLIFARPLCGLPSHVDLKSHFIGERPYCQAMWIIYIKMWITFNKFTYQHFIHNKNVDNFARVYMYLL